MIDVSLLLALLKEQRGKRSGGGVNRLCGVDARFFMVLCCVVNPAKYHASNPPGHITSGKGDEEVCKGSYDVTVRKGV